MKKFLSILLCIIAVFTVLAGCGAEKAPEPQAEPVEAESSSELKFTQEKVVKKDKFLENENYAGFLSEAEAGFLVPGLAQYVIPQGITYSPEAGLIFISNYSAVPDAPSVISAVDGESGEITGEFPVFMPDGSPFTSHMGGIAAAGDWVYVSAKADEEGNYQIARISLAELQQQGRHEIKIDKLIKVQTSPAFLNYSGGYLWIGNFYHPKGKYELPRTFSEPVKTKEGESGCIILACEMDENGELKISGSYPKVSFTVCGPDRIQGLSFKDEKLYLSQSYGRKNDSSILVYDFKPAAEADFVLDVCGTPVHTYALYSDALSESITAMPMTEGLCLDKDGNLLILFESGAGKYDDGRDRTDTVWTLKISE